MRIKIEQKILAKNEDFASANRKYFKRNNILCINMISSPGSGKTTILEQTAKALKNKLNIAVIEGDLYTEYDADRIRKTGLQAVQIETKGACHLSAEQITKAFHKLDAEKLDVLVIENVGNLVCPSDFDLGELRRVVVLSTAEGDDKCAKYPGSFAQADVLLINKMDIAKHVDFKISKAKRDARKLNKQLKIFEISAKTSAGMDKWYNWLLKRCKEAKK